MEAIPATKRPILERIAPSGATADDLDLCVLALRLRQAPTMALTASTARVPSTAAGTLAVLALKMPGVGVSEAMSAVLSGLRWES